MGDLYRGLDSGLPPNAALRQAKLALLHSNKEFRKPFYWAPLQIYTGLLTAKNKWSQSPSVAIGSESRFNYGAAIVQNVNRLPNWNCRGLFTVFPINPQSVGIVRLGTFGMPSCA